MEYTPGLVSCLLIFTSVSTWAKPIIEVSDAVVNPGTEVKIKCLLTKPVDAPQGEMVMWYKRQLDGEIVTLAMFTRILVTSFGDRMKIVDIRHADTSHIEGYEILIPSPTVEDSGEYGCYVGLIPNNPETDAKWTTLQVTQPVETIEMYGVSLHNMTEYHLTDGQTVRLTDKEGYKLVCRANDSSPAADLTILVGENDWTHKFEKTETSIRAENSLPALAKITYVTKLESREAMHIAFPERILCRAKVTGQDPPLSISIMTEFKYKPVITCEKTVAELFEENVKLICRVKADPMIDSTQYYYTWTALGGEKVEIREGGGGDVTTTSFLQNDERVTTMKISRIQTQHFKHDHYIVTENEMGETRQSIILEQDKSGEIKDPNSATSTSIATSVLLLCTGAALWAL